MVNIAANISEGVALIALSARTGDKVNELLTARSIAVLNKKLIQRGHFQELIKPSPK